MDRFIDGATKATYLIGGLLAIDWLVFLDVHARAFGVLIGGATFIANVFFQIIRLRRRTKAD
jgi:hypothetical protein